jgi:hypothetical protein
MANIDNFKSALGAGGARPNQFGVTITWPNNAGPIPQDGGYHTLVTGAALPASNVNPTILQYRGRELKLAGERTFDPWTMTIVNDTGFSLRNAFEDWMELMNNKVDNGGETIPSNYLQAIYVTHLDRNDSKIAEYRLDNAFPINMSEIALQYAQNDVIEEYTVTVQYSHYERIL